MAHVALRLRNARTINVERLVLSVLFLALIPIATMINALYSIVAVNVLLWAMITFETFYVYDERRYFLRHDMEIDIPGSS